MHKIIVAIGISAPLLLLGGCTLDSSGVNRVVYDPGYSNDYVYSVNYYNNRPYWGNNYYYSSYGYGGLNDGYWGDGYYNGY